MLTWFRKSDAANEAERSWVEKRMAWAMRHFGLAPLMTASVTVPDSEEQDPANHQGTEAEARVLLDEIGRKVGLDPASLELRFENDQRVVGFNTEIVDDLQIPCALSLAETEIETIRLGRSKLGSRTALAVALAREVCRLRLLATGKTAVSEPDFEQLVDLTTVFFGMGVLTANGGLAEKGERVGHWWGWRADRATLLKPRVFGYVLALFAKLRGDGEPEWSQALRPDVLVPFREAYGQLSRSSLPPLIASAGAATSTRSGSATVADSEKASFEQTAPERAARDDSVGHGEYGPDELFAQAVMLLKEQKWQQSADMLSLVIARNPQDAEAYQERTIAHLGLKKLREALLDGERAVQLAPDAPESYLARGESRLHNNMYAQAEADLSRYLKEEDLLSSNAARVGRVRFLRGVCRSRLGQWKRALSDLTAAVCRWPQYPEPYRERAEVYARRGMAQKAAADREEAERRSVSFENEASTAYEWSFLPALMYGLGQ